MTGVTNRSPHVFAVVLFGGILAASATPAGGALRLHPTNPRYFTDGTKHSDGLLKAVYLTGSHTWSNLIDRGPSDPPAAFDFDSYLDFLEQHNHNFIRLWARHVTWYHDYGEKVLHAAPLAWPRTGPGLALDGKPKFDLSKFNNDYFARLRRRVGAAERRGIYVSVMLFGGSYECRGGWRGNPFNAQNNINGIDGDLNGDGHGFESHTLQAPSIVRLHEAYVSKVIDTVNGFDNVLYEISNEGDDSSKDWQHHLIGFIHSYEDAKPKQHPVGMTPLWTTNGTAQALSASPAEWTSPQVDATGVGDIPAANGPKVSLVDSDHWFVKEIRNDPIFGREWVWKTFCRGHNPILMEHLAPMSALLADLPFDPSDPGYAASRHAMGHTRRFAERMILAAMAPHNTLASSGFCLANPGDEYLVYKPTTEQSLSVNLKSGTYHSEWFDPVRGIKAGNSTVLATDGWRNFKPPFDGDAVLYLKRANELAR